MAKSKPFIEVFIDCPECQSELSVKVNRKRTNTPEPAEYDVSTDITTIKQGSLFAGLKPKAKATRAKTA